MRMKGEREKEAFKGKPLGVEDTGRIFLNLCSPKTSNRARLHITVHKHGWKICTPTTFFF